MEESQDIFTLTLTLPPQAGGKKANSLIKSIFETQQ